jgi:AraC family transcriptional regulator of arabinose operon
VPIKSGFPGERISVLPRPLVAEALQSPVTSRLTVTDCGYFPHAADHQRSRPHGCAETIVIFCVSGSGWCTLPAGSHQVRPGQVLVVPASVAHTYGSSDDSPWTVWWMHLRGTDVAPLVQATGMTPADPVATLSDVTRPVALVDEALRDMEHDDSLATLQEVAGAAWHALALVSATRNAAYGERGDPVRAAIDYLRQHFAEPVSVADLATAVGFSPSHFSALFRRATGCGPHEYQTRLRMTKSRQLLDTTDLPVGVVARRVGYRDPLYFSRQFRAVHGITASEHRARAKG